MNANLKVCIVGYGGMGEWHHKHLVKMAGLEVVGVCDVREDRRAVAAEGELKTYASVDEVLEVPEIDIVLFACPNQFHAEYSIRAMEAGKHVICEKPVTMNIAELEQVIATRDHTGKVFAAHQNRRWDSDFLTIRKLLRENRLGKVYSISSKVLGSRGVPEGWRRYREAGGGMLLDWGVHMIDQLALMIHEPISQVDAHFYHTEFTEVDDGFWADFYYPSGLVAHVEVDTNAFVKEPRWILRGSDGSVVIPDWGEPATLIYAKEKTTLWEEEILYTSAGPTKTMAPRTRFSEEREEIPLEEWSWTAFYENFAGAVRGEADLFVRVEESLYVMKLMEACVTSDREKRRVEVDFFPPAAV